jgi:hypothetical protein
MIHPDQFRFIIQLGLAGMAITYGWPFFLMCIRFFFFPETIQ